MKIRLPALSFIVCAALVALALPAAAATPRVAAIAPVASQDGQVSAAGDRAFAEISACVASSDTLLAMIVVDESGSLRSTDPSAQRVPAITTAVDALEELKASAPGRLDVQLAMSTFAESYEPLVGWGDIGTKHAERLRASAANELPKRNHGQFTDYRQALKGAQHQLDSRAAALAAPSACKVLLWFTDGALDVGSATSTAAGQLCRPQGIVDGLRRDHVAVVAMALFTPGGQVSDGQRDQLRAVAEGTGTTVTCGKTPISSDASSGVYLSADDPAALRRLFAGATALMMPGAKDGPTVTCPSIECPKGRFTFDLDPGVGGFRVVADVGARGGSPSLVMPDGTRVTLPTSGSKTFPVPGGSLEAFARDGLVTATLLTKQLPSKPSTWQIDLGRTGGGVDLYWYWGTHLTLDTPKLVAGDTATLRGTITGPDGAKVDPRLYEKLELTSAVGSATAPAAIQPDGSFIAEVKLPADSGRSEAAVSMTANARTRGSGLSLGPLTATQTVPVTLPPAFPSLSPTSLRLPALEGLGTRTAEVGVTGSKLGATRVCFKGSSIASPAGGLVHASSSGGPCVELSAGEHSRLRVDLAPGATADGIASGDLTFAVTGADGSGTIEASVPTEFTMTRPVDEGTRWLLVALLITLALLVPVLLLLLAEWLLLGRFKITPTHQSAAVRVTLTRSGPERISVGRELVGNKDLRNLSLSRAQSLRRYPVPGTDAVLRIGNRLDILRGSTGLVTVGPGALVATSTAPFSRRAGREAGVHLGRANLWFVITDPTAVLGSETPEATLVALFPADDPTHLSERVAQIQGAPWDSMLAALVGHAEKLAPTSAGSPHITLAPTRADYSDEPHAFLADPLDELQPDAALTTSLQSSAQRSGPKHHWDEEGMGSGPSFQDLPPIDF